MEQPQPNPLIRRTAERLLEELLQRITALNEEPRFLARVAVLPAEVDGARSAQVEVLTLDELSRRLYSAR